MITVTDLIQPVTVDEAKTSIYAVLIQFGVPTTGWKAKSVVRPVVYVVAVLLAAVSVIITKIAKMAFREHATGDWEALRAKGFYGLTRFEATFAPGVITLNNTGGGVYNNVAVGNLIIQNNNQNSPSFGKTYHNSALFSLAALQTGLDVPIIADEAGSGSSAAPGDIQGFVTVLSGVTCTNAAAVIGRDAEGDDDLKAREDYSIDAISPNGAPGAYAAVAMTLDDGSPRILPSGARITRVRVSSDSGTGEVTVTCATASGAVTGDVGDPATDLGAVNYAIQTTCVPVGIPAVTVRSATAHAVPLTYEAWIYSTSGLTGAQVQAAVAAQFTTWITTREIAGDVIPPATAGYVYLEPLKGAVKAASAYLFNLHVSLPAADEAIAEDEVPTVGTITCTAIHVVTP